MMRVVFFSTAAHECMKERKPFLAFHITRPCEEAGGMEILRPSRVYFSGGETRELSRFAPSHVCLNLSELFRLRSVKIRRFKGCEYVYVNGESLKIYINLWIYGAEQNAAVV